MSINWYPGHMAKTRRLMLADLKHIDMVCELVDARIPRSSRNPDLIKLSANKYRMLVLNRADQADPISTKKWLEHYKKEGYTVIDTDSKHGGFNNRFVSAVNECCAEVIAKNEAKGLNRTIKAMIMGIPNVGKSSFINRLLGKKSAIAADRPGVTRHNSWFNLAGKFDFMDTPGMLWPKIESDEIGYKLAFCGTIKDEILDREDLACQLIKTLSDVAPKSLIERYGIESVDARQPYEALCEIAQKRHYIKGGEPDTERMAITLLDEFRSGKLGRITLEMP